MEDSQQLFNAQIHYLKHAILTKSTVSPVIMTAWYIQIKAGIFWVLSRAEIPAHSKWNLGAFFPNLKKISIFKKYKNTYFF